MFCPRCGFQVSDDLKFCKQCGASLRGAREAMTSSSTEEKFDLNKTRTESLPEEARKWLAPTPEEKRLSEIKDGVLTIFTGVGAMIFLYFFFEAVAKKAGDGADIIRSLYWLGIVLVLIGAGMIFNALFISQRLVKPKEQQTRPSPLDSSTEAAYPIMESAKTTDQLVVDAAPSGGASATEDPTLHLIEDRGSRIENR